jgi:hypothetical protein
MKILTFLYGDFIAGEYSDGAGNLDSRYKSAVSEILRLKRFHDMLSPVQIIH